MAISGSETKGVNLDTVSVTNLAQDINGNFSLGALGENVLSSIPFIETDAEKAAQIAASINVGTERIDSDVTNMYAKVQNVGEVWTGQDSEAFKVAFDDLKAKINQNASTLSSLASTIIDEANVTAAQNRKFTMKANNRYELY
jgi:hypothetical protein